MSIVYLCPHYDFANYLNMTNVYYINPHVLCCAIASPLFNTLKRIEKKNNLKNTTPHLLLKETSRTSAISEFDTSAAQF